MFQPQVRHRCYNYRRCTTTKTEVFASVRNSHRTSQLGIKKHFFLLKCQFTISHEHNNSFHLNFIYKQQTQASILYRHHLNFRTTATFFSKSLKPPYAACIPRFRMISFMANHQRQAVQFVFHCFKLREKIKQKSQSLFRILVI